MSSRTLFEQPAVTATESPFDNRLVTIDTFDVTFTGFDGAPTKAWLRVPAGTGTPLPTVVRYRGHSESRGIPFDATFADAGYAQFVMDSLESCHFAHGCSSIRFLSSPSINRPDTPHSLAAKRYTTSTLIQCRVSGRTKVRWTVSAACPVGPWFGGQ